MDNGIYDPTTKKFYPLSSRAGLRTGEIQDLLKTHHHHSKLACGCELDNGRLLELLPVQIDGPERWFTVSRAQIDEHHNGCFLRRQNDDDDIERIRATSIFGRIKSRDVPERMLDPNEAARQSRAQYETFAGYARKVLSRGVADAYIKKNYGLLKHSNPTSAEVFSAIVSAIRLMRFSDGLDGFAGAIRRGARLRFGLVFGPVVREGVPSNSFDVFWWDDGAYSFGHVGVDPLAMGPATADLRIFKNYQAPPYFIMAAQDEECVLQRIFFHQVAANENYFVPTESGAESATAVALIESFGVAHIKPIRTEDTERLLAAFGVELEEKAPWSYRPDFLALWLSGGKITLQIREQRGFKLGTMEWYDRLMVAKEIYYKSLKASCMCKYKEIDGTDLTWVSPTNGPVEWTTDDVRYEGLSAGYHAL